MKLSRFTSAIIAASLVTTVNVAQTPEELKRELDAVKAQVASQSKLINQLQNDKGEAAREASVETEINRLSDRLAAGTVVESKANKVTMTGEFRFRSALELGDTAGGVERDGWWNDSRVRLGFGYEFSKDITAYAELQTHFVYGDNNSDSGVSDASGSFGGGGGEGGFFGASGSDVSLYQAWVKMGNIFCRPEFSSKLGRQEIVLGNQFQFGNADWYNGLTFDGGRWDWNSDSFSLTGLILRTATLTPGDTNQSPAYGPFAINGDGHDHDEIYSLYFTLKTIKNHTLDLYWIYVNEHIGLTRNSGAGGPFPPSPLTGGVPAYFHTFGARIGGNVDVACGLDWNLEAAYQTGHLSTGTPQVDVEGLAIEGEVGLTFNRDNKLRAWVRGLFAEGPDEDGTDTGYISLFPNRHSNTANFRARYGAMDVFPMANVFALTGGVHFDPSKDWTIGANVVWGQQDSDPVFTPGSDEAFGFEIDVWAEYRYSEAMTFSAGVAMLFPDDQLDNAVADLSTPFDDDSQFLVWLQARLFF
jgi:hypothetical protein